jgi:hypothetical protein
MPRILPLDPATYQRHPIHQGTHTWAETNCYTDVIIELLHGMGFEPLAALPFTFAIDFDVDQWTFFKFPTGDIEELYGISFYELAPWRPLVWHIEQQVAAGRPVLVELDSYFLPDTSGTAYKLAHVKTTVAVNAIDSSEKTLGYFHNQSYHALSGQDFNDIFQIDGLVHERMLPPYIEFVKALPQGHALQGEALIEASIALLQKHLKRVPPQNPFGLFKNRMLGDMDWLLGSDISVFHGYSFATFRQYGACFELCAVYLKWLEQSGVAPFAEAVPVFEKISTDTKNLQLKLARSMYRKQPFDLQKLDELAGLWERGMSLLDR